jgi:hypothetical protein
LLLLDCAVFDLIAPGSKRKAGEYLCETQAGEVVGVTRDHHPQMVSILGAGPYHLNERAAFEVVVDGREACPLLCTGDTELYVFAERGPQFREVRNLGTGMELWLPVDGLGKRLSQIKQIRRIETMRYYDSECNAVQLLLRPRGVFACVSGFCR